MTNPPPDQNIDPIVIIGSALILLSYFTLHLFIEHRLRRYHDDAWRRLRKPRLLLGPGTLWAVFAIQFFMLTTRHKALNDRALTLAVYGLRAMFLLSAAFGLWCV